jgi:serine/threonine protein kinase
LIENRSGLLPEAEAAFLFRQMASAVAHLHAHGWAHRDLKPEHVAVNTTPGGARHARIVDFGDAAQCARGAAHLRGFRGTPLYMAPEVAAWYGVDEQDAVVPPPQYGVACDCWSLGATIFVVLCGEAPFDQDAELSQLVSVVQRGDIQLTSPAWSSVSAQAKALVRGLLAPQAQRRLTAEQAAHDPWLDGEAQSQSGAPLAHAATPTSELHDSTPTKEARSPVDGSAVSTNAHALLKAATDELEAMRERLRESRASEVSVGSQLAGLSVAVEVVCAEVGEVEEHAQATALKRSTEARCLRSELAAAEEAIAEAVRRADAATEAEATAMHALSLAED